MPLSPPAAREIMHTRAITLHGYQRADGLLDAEAHLVDTKPYAFGNVDRGTIEPGEPLHEFRFDHASGPACYSPCRNQIRNQLGGPKVSQSPTRAVAMTPAATAGSRCIQTHPACMHIT